MKDQISFEGIGQTAATFCAGSGVTMGQVVKLSGDSTVAPCGAGEKFCGVAITDPKDGYVAVQMDGFAAVPCADATVTVGYVSLCGDGNGGVKKPGESDTGAEYLVISNDGAGTITIKM